MFYINSIVLGLFDISKKLTKFYFLKFMKKYERYKIFHISIVFSICFLLCITYFISFPILISIYLGMIITRKNLITKMFRYIRTRKTLYHYFLIVLVVFIVFLLIILIFPLIFIGLMFVGNRIEIRKYKWKVDDYKPIILSDIRDKDDLVISNEVNLPLKKGKYYEK